MMASVFIEPHERHDAIVAYRDRLTPEQIDQIEDAPEGAIINLRFGVGQPGTTVQIIEEG
jgi:hypothetical protein